MEVTNVMDHVTHAIVSPGQSRSFQVSDNAEFFHIISDALYSDKPLAVVREILCNAWDAHIENGLTEIAVEVNINDEYMTFTDFGVGIADNMIEEIYGTFGNSTKQHDGNQTGGFGLGSKAPFCWAEHFEVTSNHMGVKTIYSMAKSSAMVGGKPSITPLVSILTDDTGISVKVETKGARTIFEALVQKIPF